MNWLDGILIFGGTVLALLAGYGMGRGTLDDQKSGRPGPPGPPGPQGPMGMQGMPGRDCDDE